jgi:hypothetical protein
MPEQEEFPSATDPESLIPYDRRKGKALVKTLRNLYEVSKATRDRYIPQWTEYWNQYLGFQTNRHGERVMPDVVHNHLIKLVEFLTASLIEGGFEFNIRPTEIGDEGIAELLRKAAEWQADKMNLLSRIRETVRDGYIFGTAIAAISWRPDAVRGHGCSSYRQVRLDRFCPDFDGYDLDTMSFVIEEVPVNVKYVYRRWKVKIPVRENLSDGIYETGIYTAINESPLGMLPTLDPVGGSLKQWVNERGLLYNCWVRDWILMDVGIDVPESLRHKAKYPGWLNVIFADGLDTPIEIRANYSSRQRPPYVVFRPNSVSGFFYGISELHPLIGMQRAYNERMLQIDRHTEFVSNPVRVYSRRADFLGDEDELVGPGQTMIADPGEVYFLQPPPLSSEVFSSAQMILNGMEDISGIHETAMGKRSPQIATGVAITALQSRSRVRLSAQSMTAYRDFLQEIGEILVSNYLDFVPVSAMARYYGDEFVQDISEEQIAALQSKIHDVIDLDIRVEVGESGEDKANKRMLAMGLANSRILDPVTILEMLDFPNLGKAIRRMEQMQQMQMQAQLASAQHPAQQEGQPNVSPPNTQQLDPIEVVIGAQDWRDLPNEMRTPFEALAQSKGNDYANRILRLYQQEIATAKSQSTEQTGPGDEKAIPV